MCNSIYYQYTYIYIHCALMKYCYGNIPVVEKNQSIAMITPKMMLLTCVDDEVTSFSNMMWLINEGQHDMVNSSISWNDFLLNSLFPGRCGSDSKCGIFKHVLVADILTVSCGNALRWISQYIMDDESTLVQFVAWCHQATSHYLN